MRINSHPCRVLSAGALMVSALFIVICSLSVPLSAESLFLKDGSIIEGRIKSENDTSYQVETADKKVSTIKRSKVMRIINDNSYKEKKYIKKRDGKIVEGYIVEENTDEYTLREKLDSPGEFTLDKSEVVAMSSEKYITKTTYYLLGTVPGVAQIYADKNTEGIAFMGGFVVSCGLTGWAYYDFNTKKKAYDDLTLGASQSTFDKKYDEYRTASYVFMGTALVTALVYAANWVDVIWFAAPDFGGSAKSAGAGDVFYNITLCEPDCTGYTAGLLTGITGEDAPVYDYSLVKVSAGMRF